MIIGEIPEIVERGGVVTRYPFIAHPSLVMTSFGVRGVFLHHRGCGSPSTRRASSAAAAAGLRDVLRAELDGIREAGTWKAERVITTPQAAVIRVQGRSGTVLNFCANNYLGLSVSLVES